jgi:UDP-N-acetylmuramyl pentapeptide synthase
MKPFARRQIAKQLEKRVQRLITQYNLQIIAITGSVGKTSTKLAVAEVLRQKYRVLAHQGNFNSEIGLPLSIFELDVPNKLLSPRAWLRILRQIDAKLAADYPYDVLVLELGVDEPGDMAKFMRYIQPDIGIVTGISMVHLAQFGSIEALAREKMTLAHGSKAVLLNADDERVMGEVATLKAPVQTYGLRAGDTHFEHIKRQPDLMLAADLVHGTTKHHIRTHYVAEHSLIALAAAAAIGDQLGLTERQIVAGLEASQPFPGRMRLLPGRNGAYLLDDTYNADPRAVKAALATLVSLPGRHIAILGSMNELGNEAEHQHRAVGQAAAEVDLLITIGQNAADYLAPSAIASGLVASQVYSFNSPYEAGAFARTIIRTGDVVLAKGSQNKVYSEEALAQLLAEGQDATQLLVRQSASWLAKKKAAFQEEN